MESATLSAVLPPPAFFSGSADDHSLGVVQLLRSFFDCVAIIRDRGASHLGAVPLSRNGTAHPIMAYIAASSSWLSPIGISCGDCIWRDWRRGFVVRRSETVPASGDADGVVHLSEHSVLHGA